MTGRVLADGSSQAGPLGLLVIALLGLAVYFLGRSLSKHLRRVPASFDPPTGPGTPAGPVSPVGSAGSAGGTGSAGPASAAGSADVVGSVGERPPDEPAG